MKLNENLLYIMLIVFIVGFLKEFYIVYVVRNFLIEDKIVKINWNDIYVGVKLLIRYYVCYFINFKFINLN